MTRLSVDLLAPQLVETTASKRPGTVRRLRSVLRRCVPEALLAERRRRSIAAGLERFHSQWDAASDLPAIEREDGVPRRLLIFPSDPGTIIGALGDDAMISATVAQFRAENPDIGVDLLCKAGPAEAVVRDYGYAPVVIPGMRDFPGAIAALLRDGRYDAAVIVGADVMDGYYHPEFSRMTLVVADLAARAGLRSIILGFSFNQSAAPELERCFARLDPRVALNLRDEISLARLAGFAPVAPRLVADVAFTLQPGTVDDDTAGWIATQHAAGRRVVGVNLHPMLVKGASGGQIDAMVQRMADALTAVSSSRDIAWILLPHDYRDASGDGDGICLRPLQALLKTNGQLICRYFEGQHRAAALKALAGMLDGVVTGRMHLAIAALGCGVPVLCLSYQDKFEGLFRHFDMPQDLLLPPAAMEDDGVLVRQLDRFLTDLPDLAGIVATHRDRVTALSKTNFLPAAGSR